MKHESHGISAELAYDNYEEKYAEVRVTYFTQSRIFITVGKNCNLVLGLEDAQLMARELQGVIDRTVKGIEKIKLNTPQENKGE